MDFNTILLAFPTIPELKIYFFLINMKTVTKFLRKSKTLIGLKKDFKTLLLLCHLIKRKRIIDRYFKSNKIKKLHLGSNITVIDGWLCSDIHPKTRESIYLNVIKKFPFTDNSFDYIFSEHLIEHLPLADGWYMLKECYRTLKVGGKIRIATPNLEELINLYSKRKENYREDYIKWSINNFEKNYKTNSPVIVLNTLFHNWQHQFLYDFELLSKIMTEIGFINIEIAEYGGSKDINFKNIERHHLNIGNLEMIQFETFIIVAQK